MSTFGLFVTILVPTCQLLASIWYQGGVVVRAEDLPERLDEALRQLRCSLVVLYLRFDEVRVYTLHPTPYVKPGFTG